MSGFNSKEID